VVQDRREGLELLVGGLGGDRPQARRECQEERNPE